MSWESEFVQSNAMVDPVQSPDVFSYHPAIGVESPAMNLYVKVNMLSRVFRVLEDSIGDSGTIKNNSHFDGNAWPLIPSSSVPIFGNFNLHLKAILPITGVFAGDSLAQSLACYLFFKGFILKRSFSGFGRGVY
jgi:hypothetical protein